MVRTCCPRHPVAILTLSLIAAILFFSCSSTVRFSSKPQLHREKRPSPEKSMPEQRERKTVLDTEVEPSRLTSVLNSFLGTPYHWGGMSPAGIDCSGLVCCVFRELGNVALPHDARLMHRLGRKIPLAQARPGDLLFFSTGFWNRINHVGVYTGNGRFVHASTRLGVIESGIDDGYYRSRFVEARRLFR